MGKTTNKKHWWVMVHFGLSQLVYGLNVPKQKMCSPFG